MQRSIDVKQHKSIIFTDAYSKSQFITTKHLLKSLFCGLPLYIDTTFKLIRKPVTVFGSDQNGHFNPVGLAITDGRLFEHYQFVFQSIKDNFIDWQPESLFCIATPAIRTAAANVFGNKIVICTTSAYVKKSVNDQLKRYSINESDRIEIVTELNSIGMAKSDKIFKEAIQAFLLKWNKYADFIQYFERKWVLENPNWRTSPSFDELQALFRTMNGLNSVEMLIKCVGLWSELNI